MFEGLSHDHLLDWFRAQAVDLRFSDTKLFIFKEIHQEASSSPQDYGFIPVENQWGSQGVEALSSTGPGTQSVCHKVLVLPQKLPRDQRFHYSVAIHLCEQIQYCTMKEIYTAFEYRWLYRWSAFSWVRSFCSLLKDSTRLRHARLRRVRRPSFLLLQSSLCQTSHDSRYRATLHASLVLWKHTGFSRNLTHTMNITTSSTATQAFPDAWRIQWVLWLQAQLHKLSRSLTHSICIRTSNIPSRTSCAKKQRNACSLPHIRAGKQIPGRISESTRNWAGEGSYEAYGKHNEGSGRVRRILIRSYEPSTTYISWKQSLQTSIISQLY